MGSRGAKRRRKPVRRRISVTPPILLFGGLLAIHATSIAEVPPKSVTACTTLRAAGSYEIDATLTASGATDCIAIAASNVVLNLNGWLIQGGGGAAGVHVLPKAANTYIEGRGTMISGFNEGVEIDGVGAVAENFTAASNTDAGVYLNNSRQARVANFTTSGNLDGVRVSSGTDNVVEGVTAHTNSRYGVWLESTSYNSVEGFLVEDNQMAGVYVGCWPTGPQGTKCPRKIKPSNYNSILDGSAVKNSAGDQAFGIAIDLGNSNNRVSGVTTSFNSESDLVDDNPDCGNSIWIDVVLGTTNQTEGCIP
jgi:parallel beta-helix repeat protein